MTEDEMKQKLWEMPGLFRMLMIEKQYAKAKHVYEQARTVAIFMELKQEEMNELFGIRGDVGQIVKNGLFNEEEVMRAYERSAVRGNNGHENYKYEG